MSSSLNLPSTWALAPISAVADINPRSFCSVPAAFDKTVHFVPMSAVTEEFGGIDVSSKRSLGEVQKGYTAFLDNDVLFAKITPCMENGKVALVPPLSAHLAFGSTEFHVLRAQDKTQPSWLAYFLSQSVFRKLARQNMTGSAGQLRVTTTWLANTLIPVAPAAEQTRIIAKLGELLSDLDAGAAELKAAQKKLVQYRQSLLKAAVEGSLTAEWRAKNKPTETGAQLLERILNERRARWEAKQLAKFKEQDKTPPKDWQKKYPEPMRPDTSDFPALPKGWVWANVDELSPNDLTNGRSVSSAVHGAKVLRLTAVRDGKIDLTAFKHGDWSDEEAHPFLVRDGDLLIVRGNGSLSLVGRMGLVHSVDEPVAYPDTLIKLRVLQDIVSPDWVAAVWDSTWVRNHIELRARTSAGIYKISQPDILSTAIPVPPLAEQLEALSIINNYKTEQTNVNSAVLHAIKQSTAQRQNILRAAFSGELVAQDPNDEPASVLLERIRAERAAQGASKTPRGRRPRSEAKS